MKEERLLFLISQPRSGSTLLATILSNSDAVSSIREESWLLLPFLSFSRPDLVESVFGSDIAIRALSKNFSSETIFAEMNDCLRKLYSNYLEADSLYLLDKTPRYYEILDEIVQCFPKAKIIILKRNPLDVYTSIHQRWPRKRFLDLKDFARDLLYAPILINQFLKKNISNPKVYYLKYENLVNDPKQEIMKLFAWLDIPFSEDLLKYDTAKTPEFGDNKLMKFNSVHNSSLNGWQQLIKKKKHKSFMRGYISYLLQNEYNDYDLKLIKHHSTFRFRTLLDFYKFSASIDKQFTKGNVLRVVKYYMLSKVL